MGRRRPAALLAAITAGAVFAGGFWAGTRRPPHHAGTGAATTVRTATVTRTDVAARDLEAGTIGYAGDWRPGRPRPRRGLPPGPPPGAPHPPRGPAPPARR